MANSSTKYAIYSQSDNGPGEYLGSINQTLRVVEVADGDERHINALQYLVDQHPARLLIMPVGEHKKNKATTLARIAPNPLPAKRRENLKKRSTKGNGRDRVFSFETSNKINALQRPKSAFSKYPRFR